MTAGADLLRIAAAYAIFFASYIVFALGKFPGMKIDRPGAAIIGAVLMVAFRVVGGGGRDRGARLRDAGAAVPDDADRGEPAAGGVLHRFFDERPLKRIAQMKPHYPEL